MLFAKEIQPLPGGKIISAPEDEHFVGREAAKVLLWVCVVGSFGVAAVVQWPIPSAGGTWLRALGGLMGGASVPSIFPLIWWGFRRFRYDRAIGPLTLWLVLLVVIGGFAIKGSMIAG